MFIGFNKIQSEPLKYHLSQYIQTADMIQVGNGNFWSSTARGNDAHGFGFGSNYITPQGYITRAYGFTLRCMAR